MLVLFGYFIFFKAIPQYNNSSKMVAVFVVCGPLLVSRIFPDDLTELIGHNTCGHSTLFLSFAQGYFCRHPNSSLLSSDAYGGERGTEHMRERGKKEQV